MGFKKFGMSVHYKRWENVAISLVKYKKSFRLRITAKIDFLKKFNINPGDYIDLYVGTDDDERSLKIINGDWLLVTHGHAGNSCRIDVPLLKDMIDEPINIRQCDISLKEDEFIIYIPNYFYTKKSTLIEMHKFQRGSLSGEQVRYLKRENNKSENNVVNKSPDCIKRLYKINED
jgi:hypothetical protein